MHLTVHQTQVTTHSIDGDDDSDEVSVESMYVCLYKDSMYVHMLTLNVWGVSRIGLCDVTTYM